MSDDDRWRREDPARTRPIRNWSTMYRDSWDLGEADTGPIPGTDGGLWNETVTQGVELGYRVIEEQIRQGRRVAEQFNLRSYDPAAMGSDFREAGERMWRYYADLAGLWIEFVGSLVGNIDPMRTALAAWQPRTARSDPRKTGGSPVPITLDVASARPVQVALSLSRSRVPQALRVHPLWTTDPGRLPLADVGIRHDSGGGVALRLRVPDEQPPGLYVGAVVDGDTGEPCGTLSVRLDG